MDFLLVYIREAHPTDGWTVENWSMNPDSNSLSERQACSVRCAQDLEFRFPAVVDDMNDRVAVDYAGWPERLFVVDAEGRVAYAGAQGPRGFYPTRDFELYTWPDAPPFDAGISLEEFLDGFTD